MWQIYDKDMTTIWHEYDRSMARIWQTYDRSMTDLGQEYDRAMKADRQLALLNHQYPEAGILLGGISTPHSMLVWVVSFTRAHSHAQFNLVNPKLVLSQLQWPSSHHTTHSFNHHHDQLYSHSHYPRLPVFLIALALKRFFSNEVDGVALPCAY